MGTAALRHLQPCLMLDPVLSIESCDEAPTVFDLRSDAGIDAAYRAYGADLHALARRVLDDRGLAEEATYADLADELGVPVGTVKSRVFYGLRALRDILTAMGWDPSVAVDDAR